jgi:hypothetical protein
LDLQMLLRCWESIGCKHPTSSRLCQLDNTESEMRRRGKGAMRSSETSKAKLRFKGELRRFWRYRSAPITPRRFLTLM